MTPASVSQVIRLQMVKLGIPTSAVRTTALPRSGKFSTRVYAFDVASAAEALRTLHPEHNVSETVNFALIISDGNV
jgi:hypothetical protein